MFLQIFFFFFFFLIPDVFHKPKVFIFSQFSRGASNQQFHNRQEVRPVAAEGGEETYEGVTRCTFVVQALLLVIVMAHNFINKISAFLRRSPE
jgi:hypothetical protein